MATMSQATKDYFKRMHKPLAAERALQRECERLLMTPGHVKQYRKLLEHVSPELVAVFDALNGEVKASEFDGKCKMWLITPIGLVEAPTKGAGKG